MTVALFAVGLGGSAVIGLVAWFGVQSITAEIQQAAWVIPLAASLLGLQLTLSAVAWRISVGAARPRLGRYVRIRWIREAVNSLLPVAQLGGNLVGIRMLAQRGVSGSLAAAGTTLDLTIEAGTQAIFTLAGLGVLAAIATEGHELSPWIGVTLVITALGIVGFILAQRAGLLRLVEWSARQLGRLFPSITAQSVRGLHHELMRLHRDRKALAQAIFLHLLAWVLGVAETWMIMAAMGQPVALAEAFVIESLGMAARSAGFAVPGALGVQEAGFIVVCELFAIPPDTAIALSMIKRARELTIGIPGLCAWQWSESRRLLRRG